MPKIMLIEDDTTMVGLLKTLLGIEGYQVVSWNTDKDILESIRDELPDVILLDVNLKGLGGRAISGFDLLTSIRGDQDLNQIAVIMSSGMNYQAESKAARADGFIMKPYMPDDLLAMIKTEISKNLDA